KQAKSVATGCHRLRPKFHGKQGVCRRPPPVARGPLPEKEEVDLVDAIVPRRQQVPRLGTHARDRLILAPWLCIAEGRPWCAGLSGPTIVRREDQIDPERRAFTWTALRKSSRGTSTLGRPGISRQRVACCTTTCRSEDRSTR